MSRARQGGSGFTLIEVLAVVFLTSVVMAFVLDFYVELSRSTARAAVLTRDLRRATGILDRVARDLEGAVLLKKLPEQDPLAHPWVFVAESRGSELGADHVKFDTFSHVTRGSKLHEADLAVVSYVTRDDLDTGLELLRWTSPHLPESLDREFPLPDDEGVLLLADGLVDFGMRFLREDGEWADSWDSSTVAQSGQLPLAVEIELALANEEGLFGEEEAAYFSRTVLLPVRPIEPEQLAPAPAEGEEQGENEDASGLDPAELEALCSLEPALAATLSPQVRAQVEQNCE